jgi:hypothetical protein
MPKTKEEFEYPEHQRLEVVKDQSQAIGEFLEWLSEKGLRLTRWLPEYTNDEPKYLYADERGTSLGYKYMHEGHASLPDDTAASRRYCHAVWDAALNPGYEYRPAGYYEDHTGAEKLLAEFFDIDLTKLENEKREMLAQLRQ